MHVRGTKFSGNRNKDRSGPRIERLRIICLLVAEPRPHHAADVANDHGAPRPLTIRSRWHLFARFGGKPPAGDQAGRLDRLDDIFVANQLWHPPSVGHKSNGLLAECRMAELETMPMETIPDVEEVTETDEPIVAHIVKVGPGESAAGKVLEARINGTPIEALCGYIWVPARDPKQLPVCQACKETYDMYKIFNDGLRDAPSD
jgi:hypothetical protein